MAELFGRMMAGHSFGAGARIVPTRRAAGYAETPGWLTLDALAAADVVSVGAYREWRIDASWMVVDESDGTPDKWGGHRVSARWWRLLCDTAGVGGDNHQLAHIHLDGRDVYAMLSDGLMLLGTERSPGALHGGTLGAQR